MKSINKIILIGRLGAKPESRYTKKGVSTVSFSLATNEIWVDADKQKHEHTEWHQIIVWGNLADYVSNHLDKGFLAYIEGSIKSRTWKDKSGETRKVVEVFATSAISLEKSNL